MNLSGEEMCSSFESYKQREEYQNQLQELFNTLSETESKFCKAHFDNPQYKPVKDMYKLLHKAVADFAEQAGVHNL